MHTHTHLQTHVCDPGSCTHVCVRERMHAYAGVFTQTRSIAMAVTTERMWFKYNYRHQLKIIEEPLPFAPEFIALECETASEWSCKKSVTLQKRNATHSPANINSGGRKPLTDTESKSLTMGFLKISATSMHNPLLPFPQAPLLVRIVQLREVHS